MKNLQYLLLWRMPWSVSQGPVDHTPDQVSITNTTAPSKDHMMPPYA